MQALKGRDRNHPTVPDAGVPGGPQKVFRPFRASRVHERRPANPGRWPGLCSSRPFRAEHDYPGLQPKIWVDTRHPRGRWLLRRGRFFGRGLDMIGQGEVEE